MGISAVIFDFNGVLVDDEAVHFTLFREILAKQGISISERDYHDHYLGYDDRRCFEAVLTGAGLAADRERLDRLVARKARRYLKVAERGLRFFPAVPEVLKAIAAQLPVAICSGALRSEIEYALRRLGRLGDVAAIISAEDTKKCKPDPEGYQLALARLQAFARELGSRPNASTSTVRSNPDLTATECLVVEDSLAGISSAKQAGMRTVGVTNTYESDQLYRAGADTVLDGLAALTVDWIHERFPV
jgi:beta-phosphoglucomutase-like phosphatase (HAD superfamily)